MFLAAALAVAISPCAYRPELKMVPVVSQLRIVRQGSSYQAAAHVRFSVRSVRKAQLPDDAGLRAHVHGYFTIVQRLAQASQVQALGTVPAQARAHLAKAIAALAYDVNVEYKRQVRVYDSVTENGRSQDQGPAYGFPGGPNANVYCAR
ncbi:MAG TPA: hypothetical protein VFO29_09980 [Candidatus Rubrimentiphilum sp.]|nr:hypothetical protein [Candidatus Rubrimentiphilum sp.]